MTGTINSAGHPPGTMSLHEASFQVRHECPYRALSERHPDVTIREWYLSDCQVVEVSTPDEPTDDLVEAVERLGEVLHRSVDDDGLHVVTQSCLCSLEDSIIERFEAHNCLYQPPTVHRHGWEHYSVVAFDEADVRELLADLEADREVEVLSTTSLEVERVPHSLLAPVDRLFEGATDRQLSALRLALERGYYEQPRRTSLRELATETAVARSTFEEHLRKAENKLLTNAGQFLRLVTATSADPLRSQPETAAEQAAD